MSVVHSEDDRVRVILAARIPELTPAVARGLLANLVELTEVPEMGRRRGEP